MVVAVAVKSDSVVVPESIIMVLDFFVLFLKKDLCEINAFGKKKRVIPEKKKK